MSELPIREVITPHLCLCILIHHANTDKPRRDPCPQDVFNPDSPFCDHCIEYHQGDGVGLNPDTTAGIRPLPDRS